MSALRGQTERSPRQTRHLSYIAEFTTDIQYITGKFNAWLRPFVASASTPTPRNRAVSLLVASVNLFKTKYSLVRCTPIEQLPLTSNFKTSSLVHQLCCEIHPLLSHTPFCQLPGLAQFLIQSLESDRQVHAPHSRSSPNALCGLSATNLWALKFTQPQPTITAKWQGLTFPLPTEGSTQSTYYDP